MQCCVLEEAWSSVSKNSQAQGVLGDGHTDADLSTEQISDKGGGRPPLGGTRATENPQPDTAHLGLPLISYE